MVDQSSPRVQQWQPQMSRLENHLNTLDKMLNTADSQVSFEYYHKITYCLKTFMITQNMITSNDYLIVLSYYVGFFFRRVSTG
jgi:hypothetical protein